MKNLFLLSLILLSACAPKIKIINTSKPKAGKSATLHKKFCFSKNDWTQNLYVGLRNYELSRIEEIPVKKLNPKKADEAEIMNQFLLAMEIYNLCSMADTLCRELSLNDFFTQKEALKDVYTFNNTGYGFFTLTGLKSFHNFNYQNRIIETQQEDGSYEITFENYPDFKINCSKDFYKKLLFPVYLNFVSKNKRITPYNLGVSPI